MVGFMTEQKFITPLKIGLLTVAAAYFLFTLHTMFTLSWIGEWVPLREPLRTTIFVEDMTSVVCLAFRFAGSIIAFSAILAYFMKKKLAKSTVYKVLRVVLVFEGIYWLGLITTAYYSVQNTWQVLLHGHSLLFSAEALFLGAIPTVMEAIVLPIILFIFAYKLNHTKPFKTTVKWASITGTLFIFVFWLTNTSIWVGVVLQKGISYLWVETATVNGAQQVIYHPEHLVSFVTTAFGLLALVIYSAYFTFKSRQTETLDDVNFGAVGAITLALGLYFLWNYLSWVIFAGATFNDWYRWFLGHNMDLWMLTLPLAALPLLFYKSRKQTSSSITDSEKGAC